jgi:hypothetical protein
VAIPPFQEALMSRVDNLIHELDKNMIHSFRVMVYVK